MIQLTKYLGGLYKRLYDLLNWFFCAKPKTIKIIVETNPNYVISISNTDNLLDTIAKYNPAFIGHNITEAKKLFKKESNLDLDGSTVSAIVLDTGINLQNFDQKTPNGYFIDYINMVRNLQKKTYWWEFDKYIFIPRETTERRNFIDDNNHGTHVAGIIASIAPKTKLNAIKILGSDGGGDLKTISTAINKITSDEIKYYSPLINISIGGTNYIDLSVLRTNNIIPICAAGNDPTYVSFPGKNPDALCVGAIDSNDNLAKFSGRNLDLNKIPYTLLVKSTKFTYLDIGTYYYYVDSKYYKTYITKAGNYICEISLQPYYDYEYAYTDAVSYGVNISSVNAGNIAGSKQKNTATLISMSGTSMATPQMTGISALILDALIKSYYFKRLIPIEKTIPIELIKSASSYAYNNILFNQILKLI